MPQLFVSVNFCFSLLIILLFPSDWICHLSCFEDKIRILMLYFGFDFGCISFFCFEADVINLVGIDIDDILILLTHVSLFIAATLLTFIQNVLQTEHC